MYILLSVIALYRSYYATHLTWFELNNEIYYTANDVINNLRKLINLNFITIKITHNCTNR